MLRVHGLLPRTLLATNMDGPTHYWPYYCEENVWHAAADPLAAGRVAYALFVSNEQCRVAMWEQRAAPRGEAILWDYHVALLEREDDDWTVFDPDCRVAERLPADEWIERSFGPLPAAAREFAPCFRLVAADTYRRELCSDRGHMRRGEEWRAPPPPWPAIGAGSNLMRFVDMETSFRGRVLDLEALRDFLSGEADCQP